MPFFGKFKVNLEYIEAGVIIKPLEIISRGLWG
jgi:hypothetical protein